jgi:hypothetical protein
LIDRILIVSTVLAELCVQRHLRNGFCGVVDRSSDASMSSGQESGAWSEIGGTMEPSGWSDATAVARGGDTGQTAGDDSGAVGGDSAAPSCCAGEAGGLASARGDGSGETVGSATDGVEDAGILDAADLAAVDASASDSPIDVTLTFPSCPFPLSTPPKEGCVGSSATLTSTAMPIQVGGYMCTVATNAATTRIRACVWMQDNPCVIDDEIGYCAVIEMTPEMLASLPVGGEVPLAGVTTFTIPNLYDISYQGSLNPSDVSFVPAQSVAGLQRVWMEKDCFCRPTLNSSSQTLTGSLRIQSKTSGRLAARVVLQATGVVAPTTSIQETAAVDVAFDVVPGVLLPDSGI